MERKTEAISMAAFFLFMVIILSSSPLPAFGKVTIVGEVNGANQIVADCVIYEVDYIPQGNELLSNYIGQKVEVTGSLRIEGDTRIIAVKNRLNLLRNN